MNMVESLLGVPTTGNGYSVTDFEMTTLTGVCSRTVSVDMDPQLFKEMANRVNKARDMRMDLFFGNSVNKKGRKVEKVIYNPPATIVWFNDGDKIVSQAEDEFDWETGLAICVLKKRMDRKKYNRLKPYFFAEDPNKLKKVIIDSKEKEKPTPLWDTLVRMECPNGEWEKIKKEWRQK